MKKYLIICFLIIVIQDIIAQEIENNETGTWLILTNNFKITEKLNVASAIQWRLVDFASYTRIFIVEPT